jgi:hypothetical protein
MCSRRSVIPETVASKLHQYFEAGQQPLNGGGPFFFKAPSGQAEATGAARALSGVGGGELREARLQGRGGSGVGGDVLDEAVRLGDGGAKKNHSPFASDSGVQATISQKSYI